MMTPGTANKWLAKKSKRGFRGFPVGTIAFDGPDDNRASKVAVGVVTSAGAEPDYLERWTTETSDARTDALIAGEIADFLRRHGVRSVALVDRIIGCPHEEGIDYPEGEVCPRCAFWADRDRWAGAETGRARE